MIFCLHPASGTIDNRLSLAVDSYHYNMWFLCTYYKLFLLPIGLTFRLPLWFQDLSETVLLVSGCLWCFIGTIFISSLGHKFRNNVDVPHVPDVLIHNSWITNKGWTWWFMMNMMDNWSESYNFHCLESILRFHTLSVFRPGYNLKIF